MTALPHAPVLAGERPFARFLRAYAESPTAVAAALVLLAIVLAALFASWISSQDPYDLRQVDIMDSRLPPGATS